MTVPGKYVVLSMFALVAAFALFLFSTDDEREVRDIFMRIVLDANRIPTAPFLEQLTIINKHIAVCADPVLVELENGDDTQNFSLSPKEIQERAAGAAKSSFRKLEVRFKDLKTEVAKPRATARFELTILGALTGVEGEFFEDWEMQVTLGRKSGGWLIEKVQGRNLREPD